MISGSTLDLSGQVRGSALGVVDYEVRGELTTAIPLGSTLTLQRLTAAWGSKGISLGGAASLGIGDIGQGGDQLLIELDGTYQSSRAWTSRSPAGSR